MAKPSEAIRKSVEFKRRGRPAKAKPEIVFKDGLEDAKSIETIQAKDIDLVDTRFQYRITSKTDDLVPSLIRDGQLVPVILWGNEAPYKIIDGHRRVTAIKSIGWDSVKSIVRRNISEDDAYRLSFIENAKRKSFTPMDMAHAIWKGLSRGKTPKDFIHDFNLSERQIQRYKALIDFPKQVKEALIAGKILMAHAQVFNALGIEDISPWIATIETGVSAQALKRAIQKEHKPQTKPRKFFKEEKDGFRLYPMRFSAGMTLKDKKKIIDVLEEAITIAKKVLADDE